jgi:hypothetical protein
LTKEYNLKVRCPNCGCWHPAENSFNAWVRSHRDLDSVKDGITRFDCDVLLHRYKFTQDGKSSRELQCLMFIEVKTHGANASPAQRDTLGILSQALRNRRKNINADKCGRHLGDHVPPAKAYSVILNRDIKLLMYGGHLLRMSHNTPEDSDWMTWDDNPQKSSHDFDENRVINPDELVMLLRFEIDPDWRRDSNGRWFLKPIDHRRRTGSMKPEVLTPLLADKGL